MVLTIYAISNKMCYYFLLVFLTTLLNNLILCFLIFKLIIPKKLSQFMIETQTEYVPMIEQKVFLLIQEWDTAKELKMIEIFLDRFLQGLKAQIPMGNMLFSQSLTLKIKMYALDEIQKEVPTLKSLFIENLQNNKPYQKELTQFLIHLSKMIEKKIKLYFWLFLALGFCLALILSLFAVCIFFFLGSK